MSVRRSTGGDFADGALESTASDLTLVSDEALPGVSFAF
jgi:hypothetical protein